MTAELAQAEYHKLKSLLEHLDSIVTRARDYVDLGEAESNLTAHSDKADIMDDLERNLRDARLSILGSLHSLMHSFR